MKKFSKICAESHTWEQLKEVIVVISLPLLVCILFPSRNPDGWNDIACPTVSQAQADKTVQWRLTLSQLQGWIQTEMELQICTMNRKLKKRTTSMSYELISDLCINYHKKANKLQPVAGIWILWMHNFCRHLGDSCQKGPPSLQSFITVSTIVLLHHNFYVQSYSTIIIKYSVTPP